MSSTHCNAGRCLPAGSSAWTFAAPLAVAALLLLATGSCAVAEDATAPISASELAERIEAGTAPLILDVRTAEEYEGGHIPGALNVPHDQLAARLAEIPASRTDEVVVHCQSGRRAAIAYQTLREAGYSNVRELAGHWQGWQSAGLQTE